MGKSLMERTQQCLTMISSHCAVSELTKPGKPTIKTKSFKLPFSYRNKNDKTLSSNKN